MRVAVVHDWLPFWGGAENVLEQVLALHPDADLYTLVDFLDEPQRARLRCRSIRTSFIQRLPFARRHFWVYLPWMPWAIEQFDLSGYDLVISCSHMVAKGALTRADQPHVSYVHTPFRYAWDMYHDNMRWSGYGGIRAWWVEWVMHYFRIWDSRTANGVDAFAANSTIVARRIRKIHRRDSVVIPPPVDVERFALREDKNDNDDKNDKDDFYVCVSRMVPYKGVELVVRAFAAMPGRKLVVIGDGPERAAIERVATANVEFLGRQPDDVIVDRLQRARALVFGGVEDFGIVMAEAQACGTPVIAYGKGGATDIVRTGAEPTGILFGEQAPGAIVAAVDAFERDRAAFDARRCRANAERFSIARFREQFRAFVEDGMRRAEGIE